ncbi:MAG TPA: ribosome maturation factor RimM [Thermoanaerobaculia bacterium]|jgi:16S rRNA processing protein RimM
MAPDERIVIGRVVRPHGLLGEVSVEILTDFPERFHDGLAVRLSGPDGETRDARIASVRPHGGRVLVRFEGIASPEGAESLRNFDLSVGRDEVAPRPEGFVFHWEVEGCEALDRAGRPLGVVTELADVGGRPLLVIATPGGERDVPFARPIVVSVDIARRRIVLDPPLGLLD